MFLVKHIHESIRAVINGDAHKCHVVGVDHTVHIAVHLPFGDHLCIFLDHLVNPRFPSFFDLHNLFHPVTQVSQAFQIPIPFLLAFFLRLIIYPTATSDEELSSAGC